MLVGGGGGGGGAGGEGGSGGFVEIPTQGLLKQESSRDSHDEIMNKATCHFLVRSRPTVITETVKRFAKSTELLGRRDSLVTVLFAEETEVGPGA